MKKFTRQQRKEMYLEVMESAVEFGFDTGICLALTIITGIGGSVIILSMFPELNILDPTKEMLGIGGILMIKKAD